MAETTQQPKNPPLRFKQSDGTDYPDWRSVRLGDIAEIKTGDSNKQDSNTTGEYTFFDRSNDVLKSSRYLFDAEAIIVGGEGQEFIPKYFMGKFDLHQRAYTVLNFKDILVKYAYYAIHVNRNYFKKMAVGSTVPSLRMNCFTTFEIPVPCMDEQQKIVEFLSAVDKQIALLQAKYDHLQKYKTGILQKIFTQQIRFKKSDGTPYPDWETLRLEQVAEIKMGTSPKSENYNSDKIGLPLFQGNADIENRRTILRNYTTEYTQKCLAGDILMCVRAPVGDVALCMHDGIIGRGMCLMRSQNNSFLYQVLLNIENQWTRYAQGSTFEAINSKDIKGFKVFIPTDKDEQQKIADFLSNLDNLIQAQNDKITATKSFKSGLLQKMFI